MLSICLLLLGCLICVGLMVGVARARDDNGDSLKGKEAEGQGCVVVIFFFLACFCFCCAVERSIRYEESAKAGK